MSPRSPLAAAALATLAAHAAGQTHRFTMWAEAPETVLAGETFTIGFWGSVESPVFVEGTSAMAGFGIDAVGQGSVTLVSNVTIQPWAADYGTVGGIFGPNVQGVSGGQIRNIITPPLSFSLENPILLFTFDVTAGGSGSITYTPANPNPNGGLSFYPDYLNGASIVGPNDADTSLALIGATTRIVPAPTPLMLVGASLYTLGSRRRNRR